MTRVRMLKHYESLNRGELAGFEDGLAKSLIDRKIAELYVEPTAIEAVTLESGRTVGTGGDETPEQTGTGESSGEATSTPDATPTTPPAPEVEQSPSQHKEDPPVVATGGEVTEPTAPSKKR